MKVILNKVTTYQGRILAYGDTVDVPLNVCERWVNHGICHLSAQSGIITPKFDSNTTFPLHNDGDVILNSKQQENLKKFIEEKKKEDIPVITFEDLDDIAIFREPSTDIDLIEPIPVDKYVSFDEPKISKQIKKAKKK